MTKYVITGATGMIASRLIEIIKDTDCHIYAVIRPNSKNIKKIIKAKNIEIVECNLNDIDTLSNMIDNADYFYHFAWEGVYGAERANAQLQINNAVSAVKAIEAAKALGCKKYVFAGSQAEYGLQEKTLTVDTVPQPITPYGIAKNFVTQMGRCLSKSLNIEFNVGRILSAYGENDSSHTMIMGLIDKMLGGKECDLSPGNQIWDYCYVEDVARAFLLIGEHGVNSKAYPIGSGAECPLKEYINIVYQMIGNNNAKLNFGAIKLGEKAITHLATDISELSKDTGFAPKYTFTEGIKRTIDWYKNVNGNY